MELNIHHNKLFILSLEDIKEMLSDYVNASSSGNSELDKILYYFETRIKADYNLELQHQRNAELINKKLGSDK